MILPEHVGLFTLGAAVLLALLLVVAGTVRVVRRAAALRRRIEAYEDLSVLTQLEITQARLRALERNAGGIPQLRARAAAAVAEIAGARKRLLATARGVAFALRRTFFAR